MRRTKSDEKSEERTNISMMDLIHSITISMEDKVVLEGMINKLFHESDIVLNIIYDVPKRYQKQLLLGYKKLLQDAMNSTNNRLKTLNSEII